MKAGDKRMAGAPNKDHVHERATPTAAASRCSRPLATVASIILLATLPVDQAWAQRCDPSIPGNAKITNPANCMVRAAERDGIVMGLPANTKLRIDPAKVPRCTAISAELMKRMAVAQEDFIATSAFASTFTFAGRCARLSLECQVLETGNQPILNRPPWGTVAMKCDASADRYTDALRIIAPAVPVAKVKPFVTRCLADARARKIEGPQDLEVSGYVLTCDPQNLDGAEVTVQPNTSVAHPAAVAQPRGK